VCIACHRNPTHRRFEIRVLEVEVNPKLCDLMIGTYHTMSHRLQAAVGQSIVRRSRDRTAGRGLLPTIFHVLCLGAFLKQALEFVLTPIFFGF
jgi:hypothetical protein